MKMNKEEQAKYEATCKSTVLDLEQVVIDEALEILSKRLLTGNILNSAKMVTEYLKLEVNHEKEHFYMLSLNSRLRVISSDVIAVGTVKDAYVHPREVAEMALKHKASAVVFAHNHPSGHLSPSQADHTLTDNLCRMFKPMDIQVLDHVIVTYDGSYSFAEMGVMPVLNY